MDCCFEAKVAMKIELHSEGNVAWKKKMVTVLPSPILDLTDVNFLDSGFQRGKTSLYFIFLRLYNFLFII